MEIENKRLVRIESSDVQNGTVAIPSSVTAIGDYAFCGCSSLTSITIPSSVTAIGDYAFCGCSSLTSITIPSSVTAIGDYAFCGCSSLTSITIPSSVTSIGSYAFYGCSSLTSITIPSSVTAIGSWAFKGCSILPASTHKVELILLAKEYLKEEKGLCACLDRALRDIMLKYHEAISIASTFPLFTRENAIKLFDGEEESYWWKTSNKDVRLRFLDFINK